MLFVSPHVTLTYRNAADFEMSFNFFSDFVITATGGQETHINNAYGVPAPGRHGEQKTGMRMDRRHIRLVGEVRNGKIDSETARYILHNAFNPTLEGVLTSHNTSTAARRWITVAPEELPIVEWSHQKKCLIFEIVLAALDPFWKGRPLTVAIAQTIPRWSTMTYIPQRNSRLPNTMVFGITHGVLETRFINAGNVASGFTAEFRARHGSVLNPTIQDMHTGSQIRVLHNMARGDVLTIINYLHEKRVLLNGENALHLLDTEETQFFLIQVGANRIGYLADENVSNLNVNVRYTPEYTFVGGFDPVPRRISPYLGESKQSGQLVESIESGRLLSPLIRIGE